MGIPDLPGDHFTQLGQHLLGIAPGYGLKKSAVYPERIQPAQLTYHHLGAVVVGYITADKDHISFFNGLPDRPQVPEDGLDATAGIAEDEFKELFAGPMRRGEVGRIALQDQGLGLHLIPDAQIFN